MRQALFRKIFYEGSAIPDAMFSERTTKIGNTRRGTLWDEAHRPAWREGDNPLSSNVADL
jgi:hypothetical protein